MTTFELAPLSPPLWTDSEWTFPLIDTVYKEIQNIGIGEYGLDPYPAELDIISSEQMLDAYSSIGMPVYYKHWSFGKSFTRNKTLYDHGMQGLAYEIVINSDPCVSYLMESNTMTMMALVMAHACVSGDTEYLSQAGWRRMDQYDGGMVGQYHDDGRVTFVQPESYIKREQTDFIHVSSEKISQAITDDHTVVTINQHGNLIKMLGSELAERQARKTRGFDGKLITGFQIDSSSSLHMTDDEIRLQIAIKADGNIVNPDVDKSHFNAVAHFRVRFHLKKDRKIERLKDILARMLIPFDERPSYDGRVSIAFNYAKIEKRFTHEWYRASFAQLRLIGEEVCYWDGNKGSNDSFSSEYKQDVDYVQYVWAATGNHAHLAWANRAFRVHKSERILVGLTKSGSDGRESAEPFSRIPSEDGQAYCFTVSTGMLIIRHQDKISVTGNCIGHSHFFKNNIQFKHWTDASSIMDYLVFAKEYIAKCEEREGKVEVEQFLDSCHALMNYGVSRYKKPSKLSLKREKDRQEGRDEFARTRVNDLFDRLLKSGVKDKEEIFPREPEENILYFCEKYAPELPTWKREIIRIVRKISQYFVPQMMTKTMNEGCLVEGSLISTSDGLIPIEEIVRGRKITAVWDGVSWRKVYDWVEHQPKRRVKLITSHGYEVHGGADHQLFINGNWKSLEGIEIGDKLPIGYQNEVFAQDYADLPPLKFSMHLTHDQVSDFTGIPSSYYRSVVTGRHACSEDRLGSFEIHDSLFKEHVKDRFDQATETITTVPVVLREDFAYWLGVLIGDGSMSERHHYVAIVNADTELLNNWQAIGERLFGLQSSRIQYHDDDGRPNKERIFFYSMTLLRWLRDNLDIKVGYAAPRKEIPSLVMRSPRSVMASFLQGLFDADGCAVKVRGGAIVYISRSKELIDQVQHALLRFGVICHTSQQKDRCYRLTITGQDATIFAHNVGFGLSRKQDLLMSKIAEVSYRKERNVTTTVIAKEEDVGVTFDFSVEATHQYASGAFIHHNCATYVHYRIMHRLHEKGMMTDGAMYEFLKSHTNVVFQPDFDSRHYSGLNPYALGFAMMRDIERICKTPTEEDRKWFPTFAGCGDEWKVLKDGWANYRDESFIRQFLSPTVIRHFKLFRVKDNAKEDELMVTAIHNDTGYEKIRESLADQYELHNFIPQLEVVKLDPKTRTLYINYRAYRGRVLTNVPIMVKHLEALWGFSVVLKDDKGNELS